MDIKIADYDYKWDKPLSKMQEATVGIFSAHGLPKNIFARQALDFIITAEYSMWYFEIKRIADEIYSHPETDEYLFFLDGCKRICAMIEAGYDEEHDAWWYIPPPATEQDAVVINRHMFTIANALFVLVKSAKNNTLYREMIETYAVIILGKDWKANFTDAVHIARFKQNHAKNNGNSQDSTNNATSPKE